MAKAAFGGRVVERGHLKAAFVHLEPQYRWAFSVDGPCVVEQNRRAARERRANARIIEFWQLQRKHLMNEATENGQAEHQEEFQTVEGTFAEAWAWEDTDEKPADGKVFSGIFVAVDPNGKGKKPGETFKVYHLLDENGKRRSMFGADLDSKLPCVPFGTKVRITWIREQKLSNGNTMRIFNVQCAKGTKLLEPLVTRN